MYTNEEKERIQKKEKKKREYKSPNQQWKRNYHHGSYRH